MTYGREIGSSGILMMVYYVGEVTEHESHLVAVLQSHEQLKKIRRKSKEISSDQQLFGRRVIALLHPCERLSVPCLSLAISLVCSLRCALSLRLVQL